MVWEELCTKSERMYGQGYKYIPHTLCGHKKYDSTTVTLLHSVKDLNPEPPYIIHAPLLLCQPETFNQFLYHWQQEQCAMFIAYRCIIHKEKKV